MLTKFFRHLPLHIRSPAEVESTYQLIQVLYLLNIESQSQGKLLKKEPFMIIKSPRHFWFFSRRFRRFVKTFGFRVDFRFRFREFGESGIAAFSEPRLGFVFGESFVHLKRKIEGYPRRYSTPNILALTSVTRLSDFESYWRLNLLQKWAKYLVTFLASFEAQHFLYKNCCYFIWANFLKNLATLFSNIWSHWDWPLYAIFLGSNYLWLVPSHSWWQTTTWPSTNE